MTSVLFRRVFGAAAWVLVAAVGVTHFAEPYLPLPRHMPALLSVLCGILLLWLLLRGILFPIRILTEMSTDYLKHGSVPELRLVMEKGDLGKLCAAFFQMAERVEADSRRIAQLTGDNKQLLQQRESARERAYDLSVAQDKLSQELDQFKERERSIRQATERYEAMLQNIEEYFYEADLFGNLVFFNEAMNRMLGYTHDELYGMNFSEILDGESAEKAAETFRKALNSGRTEKAYEWRMRGKDGSAFYIEISVTPMRDENDEIIGFRGVGRDISELIYLVYHDSLTGLYNRKAFFERLEDTLAIARRDNNIKHVFYLDLDRFKQVNDDYGHDVGDHILVTVAERLRAALRETDHICRLGGDEFTIILNNMNGNANPDLVAQRIIDALSRPYHVAGTTIDFITPSIGISAYPNHAEGVEALIRCADKAMYVAKEERGRFMFYSPEMAGAEGEA